MEYESFTFEFRKPENWEITMMDFYVRNGCVREEDLERILGDISIGVNAFSDK